MNSSESLLGIDRRVRWRDKTDSWYSLQVMERQSNTAGLNHASTYFYFVCLEVRDIPYTVIIFLIANDFCRFLSDKVSVGFT
jgi:hypothetical protein